MSPRTLPCPCCNRPWPWTVTGRPLLNCMPQLCTLTRPWVSQDHATHISRFGTKSKCKATARACAHHIDRSPVLEDPYAFSHATEASAQACAHYLCLENPFAVCGRLTETCVRCIAQHLLTLVRDPLFNQLVKESADSVQNREDVDSVPIIDDIRYHVTLLHGDGELSG